MRFPLSQAASMATYIAKNKLRPRPEWQKNAAPHDDASNPFGSSTRRFHGVARIANRIR